MSKHYQAVCWYETIMDTSVPVYAESPEEAEEIAEKKFRKWNSDWMEKCNGAEKKLLKIDVKER